MVDDKYRIEVAEKWATPIYDTDNKCLHNNCDECGGKGIKKDGTECVHMISCKCPRCSPSYTS